MSDKPMTTEYEGLENLRAVVAQINERMNALAQKVDGLDSHVETTIEQRLLEMEERIIDRIGQSEVETRNEIEKRVAAEKTERVANTEIMSKRLDEFESMTNNSLRAISDKITSVNDTVQRVDGTIVSWHIAVESAQESFKQAQRRLDETDNRIDDITEKQNILTAEQRQLHKTIHGDANEDGPESLFKAIKNLGDKVSTGFIASDSTLNTVLNLARNNSNSIEKIERERTEEKARWTKRMETAKETFIKVLSTPRVLLVIVLGIITIAVSINPSLQEFFQWLFEQANSSLFRPLS